LVAGCVGHPRCGVGGWRVVLVGPRAVLIPGFSALGGAPRGGFSRHPACVISCEPRVGGAGAGGGASDGTLVCSLAACRRVFFFCVYCVQQHAHHPPQALSLKIAWCCLLRFTHCCLPATSGEATLYPAPSWFCLCAASALPMPCFQTQAQGGRPCRTDVRGTAALAASRRPAHQRRKGQAGGTVGAAHIGSSRPQWWRKQPATPTSATARLQPAPTAARPACRRRVTAHWRPPAPAAASTPWPARRRRATATTTPSPTCRARQVTTAHCRVRRPAAYSTAATAAATARRPACWR
jgi:hypothetical protein